MQYSKKLLLILCNFLLFKNIKFVDFESEMRKVVKYYSKNNSKSAEDAARKAQRFGLCTGIGNLLNLIPTNLRGEKINKIVDNKVKLITTRDHENTTVFNFETNEENSLYCLKTLFENYFNPFIFALWVADQSLFLYDTNRDVTQTFFGINKLFPKDLFEINNEKNQGAIMHPSQFEESDVIKSDKKGKLIVLNGASSAGKSSIAEELLNKLYTEKNEIWLHIGMDEFMRMMDQKQNCWSETSTAPCLGFYWKKEYFEQEDKDLPVLKAGKYGIKVLESMCETIEFLLDMGIDIVTNYVNFKDFDLEKLIEKTKAENYKVFDIYAEKDVLIEREEKRGNRIIGSALAQFHTFKDHKLDSKIINNGFDKSPKDAADEIYDKII